MARGSIHTGPGPDGHQASGHGRPRGIEPTLRGRIRTASVPVLAVTAQAMKGDRERFIEAGFDGYLSKPVDVPELIRTVGEHCGR